MRSCRKKRLQEANIRVEDLVLSIKSYLVTRKMQENEPKSPEDAMNLLVNRMIEEMERLEAKVERLEKQSFVRGKFAGRNRDSV